MKLATYKDGSRDGQLVVVSRDLSTAHFATGTATRLQQVLDDWNFLSPQLEDLYATLNGGKARHAFAFDPRLCMAPLPRAVQWAAGSAYANRVERLSQARATEVPAGFDADPRMVERASDDFLGARDDAVFVDPDWGIDFESGLAVVTGDVPMSAGADLALESIRLLMLVNDWTLRHLVAGKPATAFGPVAVTPDELGAAWRGGRVHLSLESTWNGKRVGLCRAGDDMSFHFGQLIAHLARTRNVHAGSIVGSGAVSNQDTAHGYSCIADRRASENLEHGAPRTGFMQFGDTLRVEMKGGDGQSVFGSIEQTVRAFMPTTRSSPQAARERPGVV